VSSPVQTPDAAGTFRLGGDLHLEENVAAWRAATNDAQPQPEGGPAWA
jgi:hypothetical protein